MEPNDQQPPRTLLVRPITPGQRERFDETLAASHWLGAGLVGDVMRDVAIEDGAWCTLVGFGSAAPCVCSRHAMLGRGHAQRHRMLRYMSTERRLCIPDAHRRPNLVSGVLGLTMRRIASDFDRPALDPRTRNTVSEPDLNRLDLDSPSSTLARLETVPDPRTARDVGRHLAWILTVATLRTLRGAKTFNALVEGAAQLPEETLPHLGARVSPRRKQPVAPNEATTRRTVKAIEADLPGSAVNTSAAGQVAQGCLLPECAEALRAIMAARTEAATKDRPVVFESRDRGHGHVEDR